MNHSNFVSRVCALLLLLVAAPVVQSQQTKNPLTEAELIAAARAIMTTARYCALITLDSSGHAQARTLDPFPPDEHMTVWFATNPRTRKVREIRRRPRVTLYYFDRDSQAYVTIHGTARIVDDPAEKAKHWKEEWKDFYPNRARDYLLIVVTPEKLELLNVSKGILGDPQTWQPPSVSFPKNKSRQ
jgi:general stress protein 26